MISKEWATRVTLSCNVCGLEIGSRGSPWAGTTAFQEAVVLQEIRTTNKVGTFKLPQVELCDVCWPCQQHLSQWLHGVEPTPTAVVPEDDDPGEQEVAF